MPYCINPDRRVHMHDPHCEPANPMPPGVDAAFTCRSHKNKVNPVEGKDQDQTMSKLEERMFQECRGIGERYLTCWSLCVVVEVTWFVWIPSYSNRNL